MLIRRKSQSPATNLAGSQGSGAGRKAMIPSPFTDNSDMFDNTDSFTDVTLKVRGMESPLHLHRVILQNTLTELVGTKQDEGTNTECVIEWPFSTSNDADRIALIKVLQFCYGRPLSWSADSEECCAVIATLIRLQVQNRRDVVGVILRCVMDSSKQDLRVAALHLKTCVKYEECCTDECQHMDQMLSKIVLTRKNIEEHSDIVVDGCLMDLPLRYLGMGEYGEPHSEAGGFFVRCRYAERHDGEQKDVKPEKPQVCKAPSKLDEALEREKAQKAQLEHMKTELDQSLKRESEQKVRAANLESQLGLLTQQNKTQKSELEHLCRELQTSQTHQSQQEVLLAKVQKERNEALMNVAKSRKTVKLLQTQYNQLLSRTKQQQSTLAQLNKTLKDERANAGSMANLVQTQKSTLSERDQELARERALQVSLKSHKDRLERTLRAANSEVSELRHKQKMNIACMTRLDAQLMQNIKYSNGLREEISSMKLTLCRLIFAIMIAVTIIIYLVVLHMRSKQLISNAEIVLNEFKDRCPSDVLRYRIRRIVFIIFCISNAVAIFWCGCFKRNQREEERSYAVSRYQSYY